MTHETPPYVLIVASWDTMAPVGTWACDKFVSPAEVEHDNAAMYRAMEVRDFSPVVVDGRTWTFTPIAKGDASA